MKHFNNYADQRFNGQCVYCGGNPETREHVPPKVFLDKPYPQELPVVEACRECNQGFSKDEEYMTCLLASVIAGTTSLESIERESISRTLAHSVKLAEKIRSAKKTIDGKIIFDVEHDRIHRVVKKIAACHVLYELNITVPKEGAVVALPILNMSDEGISAFESIGNGELAFWPEVGSRVMQRLLEHDENYENGWIIVQPGRYRYAVIQSEVIEVRMVFSEYLAAQVIWEDVG